MEYYKNQTWIKYVCCVYPTEAGWLLSAGSLAAKACQRKQQVGWFVALTEAHTPQTSALTAPSFIHCHTNKQGRLFPVQRFTDVGERRRRSAEKTNKSLMKANSLIWRLTCARIFIYSF